MDGRCGNPHVQATSNHSAGCQRSPCDGDTATPSEWSSSFPRENCYVVLHLQGGRRLYGWPEEWPNESTQGHFRIAEAEWLVEKNDGQKQVAAEGVSAILVPADQVEMVEFMEDASSEDV